MMTLCVLTCIRWRQGDSESGDKAQGSLVCASAASPTSESSGPSTLIPVFVEEELWTAFAAAQ
jgi:hypothetical protein